MEFNNGGGEVIKAHNDDKAGSVAETLRLRRKDSRPVSILVEYRCGCLATLGQLHGGTAPIISSQ